MSNYNNGQPPNGGIPAENNGNMNGSMEASFQPGQVMAPSGSGEAARTLWLVPPVVF